MEPNVDPGWPKANNFFTQVSYQEVRVALPKLEGAEYVNDTEICETCHEAYTKSFADNVHRRDNCEACHGPASRHVETRGKEPGLIFSFKTGDPSVRAEACLRCHEESQCIAGVQANWRTSKHAHCGVTCVDCHRGHYNVPPGTPATAVPGQASLAISGPVKLASMRLTAEPAPAKPELPSLRGTTNHLGAIAPNICYRCHCDKQDLQRIAGPHQICGPNGFNCTTCHNPHGALKEYSRKDLCLTCHNGAPTMAWHSSIHANNGVDCTDCHDPHAAACAPQFAEIDHYQVQKPKRLPMSVQQPQACYKCHAKIYGLGAMPYHHPVKEGKMVCSDCHDPHGQYLDNLKDETVNMVCYRCHAEKQGPFAYEHPPVTENCCICHEPHGSVAKDLLRQPVTFLCMRCHPGHANNSEAKILDVINPVTGKVTTNNASFRKAFYTDCTACHADIHGTNSASASGHGTLMR
jgi:DmsE family decaheme c-type cytochrome